MDEIVGNLKKLGIDDQACNRVVQAGCCNVHDALDFLFSENRDPIPVSQPQASSTQTQSIPAEDADLQLAIERSQQHLGDDEEFQRVLAESLQDVQHNSQSWSQLLFTPSQRARHSLTDPVGLRNVGNTCYLNSLLQFYYHLPEFRRKIFSYRGSEIRNPETEQPPALNPPSSAERFVLELQRLFGYMALSAERYLDPSRLIDALQHQGEFLIGGPQDVSEFNEIFVNLVSNNT
uniref:USP domain-containing protein n=1 Tax=Compsopogon caeruleus TaxID=31354 RepID=A0A7S1XET2_9RHOD|mmetsp:Transcript_18155/g.37809  ORF Transcript_18155/g.37809 Transcript_18155/m.37809 type:complete len:234 (+) Transcript_18155:203-904(+)